MPPRTRNHSIDLIRSFAIVLMVVYHFIFDLKYFGYHEWDIPDGSGWNQFRNVIVGGFMGCVGLSLGMGAQLRGGARDPRLMRRVIKVAAGAVIITGTSLLLYPEAWIYFGVLHFIALAYLVSQPLLGRPALAAALGGGMVLLYWAGIPVYGWPFGFGYLADVFPTYTVDFVSPSPWFGVVWLGVALGHTRWLRSDPLGNWKHATRAAAPGRHSLIIYLVHQPILFGGFWLIGLL
jgi:uncharacterized membrane protein